jgi:hypothetical protein
MKNKLIVQPHINKTTHQISFTILKRKSSKDLLSQIGSKDIKFIEINLNKIIK